MGQYHELVTDGRLGPAESIGLRRALYRLHATLRVHLAEEELYLRVLDRNLTAEEIDLLARGIEPANAEPLYVSSTRGDPPVGDHVQRHP